MSDIVYLDICCFKRPFDDATLERVRREAEAVAAVLDAAREGRVRLVRSPAHDAENERNPREDRRLATLLWLESAVLRVSPRPETAARARMLTTLGFAPFDALHLAFAEQSDARWFLTTDDKLLNRARNHHEQLRVQVLKTGPAFAAQRRRRIMKGSSPMSLYEIRMEGWKALTERLGPAGAMRFMMQYDPGYGDYSKERHKIFSALTIEELLESIEPDAPNP